MAGLDSRPGTYALVFRVETARHIKVGRIGELEVRPGFYVYVGSALGSGGLAARVSRHRIRAKSLRWHVDYLRPAARLLEVWYTCDTVRRECEWAGALGRIRSVSIPLEGFGSSDCTCRSHLCFSEAKPSLSTFRRRLRRTLSGHGPVCCDRVAAKGENSRGRRLRETDISGSFSE